MSYSALEILATIATIVVTVAVTFYIKDYLQKRTEYAKLRKKLQKIAGKEAEILYAVSEFGSNAFQTYTITEIDEHGVTIQNALQTIFIPAAKLFSLTYSVRRGKASSPCGCESRPASVAPAGSNRSG